MEDIRHRFTPDSLGGELVRREQAFFAAIATEMRKPHMGLAWRDCYKALLLRAEAAGMYSPVPE